MAIKSEDSASFPLSNDRQIVGTRRKAREKVMQLLVACSTDEIAWEEVFPHIVNRDFAFNDQESEPKKLLTPDEIMELESDTRINWGDDELIFIRELTAHTLEEMEYSDGLIERFAQNWELDRIALIDRILLRMAIAELIHYPQIPTKVTINEIIELAKGYSTDKSNVFINGVLDAVVIELTSSERLKKSGRGLQDH
ncbi:MAG: transcription antitermination factor NusB [Ignavibacteria bacterium]|jgi:N utilization substance protein B